MLEFEVEKIEAMIEDVDPKTDKDGEPFMVLQLSAALTAEILAFFHPDLRDKTFEQVGEDLAGPLPLQIRDRHQIYPLRRDEEMGRALMLARSGIGDPMRFEDTTHNDFELTPQDGGRVVVRWRARCRPSEAQAGRLYMLQKKYVELTVEPGELPMLPEAQQRAA